MSERDVLQGLIDELTAQILRRAAARDLRIDEAMTRWAKKPRNLLNERLERIEMEKHYAQFTLETADLRAQRELLIDVMTRPELLKPLPVQTP